MVIALLVVFGLCLGSFVNALIYRVHEQAELAESAEKSAKRQKKQGAKSQKVPSSKFSAHSSKLSILRGRSMCPNCHHELSALDLIPLLSWLMLKGKCRYCHKPISWQYPLVEASTAFLFVFSYIYWPLEFNNFGVFNFMIWLVVLVGFMALLVYDLRWMIIPKRILNPLICLAAIAVFINTLFLGGGFSYLIDTMLAVLVSAGIFFVLFQINENLIGGGDVRLGILIGLLLSGAMQGFLVLFLASLLGTIFSLPGLINRKLKFTSKIPYGPFLIIAAVIVKLFGAGMISWYKKQFLLNL